MTKVFKKDDFKININNEETIVNYLALGFSKKTLERFKYLKEKLEFKSNNDLINYIIWHVFRQIKEFDEYLTNKKDELKDSNENTKIKD